MDAPTDLLRAAEATTTVALGLLLFAGLVGLAAKAALDAWLLGSLFAPARARFEYWRDDGEWAATRLLGELMVCRFCLGYHVTFWLTILTLPIVPTAWLLPLVWLGGRAVERMVAGDGPAKADHGGYG